MTNRLRILPALSLFCALAAQSEAFGAGISYQYDNLNRLISVDYGNGMSIGYSYDATGNITRIARVTEGADLIPPTVTEFTLPVTSTTLAVDVTAFTASDNLNVTGYCIASADTSEGCSWSTSPPASYPFPAETPNGSHTLYAFVQDAAGNISLSYSAPVTLTLPKLTVTVTELYGGGGNVNSNPAGIACTAGTCAAYFSSDLSVILMPTPDTSSAFTSWSGDCGGTGNCTVAMGTDRDVAATFTLIPRAKVGVIPYGTLAAAYSAAPSGSTLEAQSLVFTENLILTRSIPLVIKGGYSADYGSLTGYTTIDGTLKIRGGTVKVNRIKVK